MTKHTAGIIERLEAALKTAREIIANDLESEIYSHSIGGWDGKSKYTLSIEGEHYVRPIKKALKKIDAALRARANKGEG